MKESTKREVAEFFRDAQYDLVFSSGWITDLYFSQRILSADEHPVSIRFHLDEEERQLIEMDPLQLKKVLQFRSRGAEFFAITDTRLYCIRDFREVLVMEDGDWLTTSLVNFKAEYAFADEAPALFVETSDIQLQASFSLPLVDRGEVVELTWSSENATRLEIIDHEEVPLRGLAELPVHKSTYVTFKATNDRGFEKYKTVFVQLTRDVLLDFRVKVFNEWTKEFTAIDPHPKYRDLYGFQRESLVRLEWEGSNATFCRVEPFGIEQLSGQHDFQLEEDMEVNVQIGAEGVTSKFTFFFKAFPVELERDKLLERVSSLARVKDPIEVVPKADIRELRQQLAEQYERLMTQLASEQPPDVDAYLDMGKANQNPGHGAE